MSYYHNICSKDGPTGAQERRKIVRKIFPIYITKLISAGISLPFQEEKKLRDQVMNYALKNNKAHLSSSVVDLYSALKSELLFRIDDNLKEQKYLSAFLFYKPFITHYIKEYRMIQQSFPIFDPDSEKRVFLPKQWYRTTQSERSDLITMAIKLRIFKQFLLPSEIHDMIEAEPLQKGMLEYLERIKTFGAFLCPDKLSELPPEPLIKFFISSLFLKRDNLSEKFKILEKKQSVYGVSQHQ